MSQPRDPRSRRKPGSPRDPRSLRRRIPKREKSPAPFKVGRVTCYPRGQVWYLRYHERGKRIQRRAGPDKSDARRLAAEINAQLECGIQSAFGFQQIRLTALRDKWLAHHEDIRRSALTTIDRYRSATAHLVKFAQTAGVRFPSELSISQAEAFVRYLRQVRVGANGHDHSEQRGLRDAGIKFILNTSSTLFNYARRQRHLPPYAENPFAALDVGTLRIEDAKPTVVFSAAEERQLLECADEWSYPLMLTLLHTGLRPAELVHLLLPEDLDFAAGWLHVRNKRSLGWQVKTRRDRSIPILPELVTVLRVAVGDRSSGPVFRQRRCLAGYQVPQAGWARTRVEAELLVRAREFEVAEPTGSPRVAKRKASHTIWRDWGALRYDYLRQQFMLLTTQIGRRDITALKTFRHHFATCLQDANVDPLIRNELLGHSPAGLGMTTRYTQTRPETKRKQLFAALRACESTRVARQRLGLDDS